MSSSHGYVQKPGGRSACASPARACTRAPASCGTGATAASAGTAGRALTAGTGPCEEMPPRHEAPIQSLRKGSSPTPPSSHPEGPGAPGTESTPAAACLLGSSEHLPPAPRGTLPPMSLSPRKSCPNGRLCCSGTQQQPVQPLPQLLKRLDV